MSCVILDLNIEQKDIKTQNEKDLLQDIKMCYKLCNRTSPNI
jgi:hypothetical protein